MSSTAITESCTACTIKTAAPESTHRAGFVEHVLDLGQVQDLVDRPIHVDVHVLVCSRSMSLIMVSAAARPAASAPRREHAAGSPGPVRINLHQRGHHQRRKPRQRGAVERRKGAPNHPRGSQHPARDVQLRRIPGGHFRGRRRRQPSTRAAHSRPGPTRTNRDARNPARPGPRQAPGIRVPTASPSAIGALAIGTTPPSSASAAAADTKPNCANAPTASAPRPSARTESSATSPRRSRLNDSSGQDSGPALAGTSTVVTVASAGHPCLLPVQQLRGTPPLGSG